MVGEIIAIRARRLLSVRRMVMAKTSPCTTRSPIAASMEAVIVEIFESRSIGPIPGQLSRSALVAAAYVQSTGQPGPRIQTAGFICGSPTTREWHDIGSERRPQIFMFA